MSICNVLRILIIWHAWDREDDNLIAQRRFIILFIHQLPINTDVHIITVDSSLNLQFKRDGVNSSWMGIVASYTPRSGSHIMPHHMINKAVETFLDEGGNLNMAEAIYFVVNESSVVRQQGKLTEELASEIIFLIYTGTSQPLKHLTTLATDNYHIAMLNTSDIEGTIQVLESVNRQSCEDSRIVCDTDRYWNGKRCRSCSFICSQDTTEPSEKCLSECPYYRRRSTSFRGSCDSKNRGNQCSDTTNVFFIFIIANTVVLFWF